jgi:hypothetical protein
MLLPHLTDAELFEMGHILSDRSKEPIKTYLLCLLARDACRAVEWLADRRRFSEKATEAFAEVMSQFKANCLHDSLVDAVRNVFLNGTSYYGWYGYASRSLLLTELQDDAALVSAAVEDREAGVRAQALSLRVARAPTDQEVWNCVRAKAVDDVSPIVRQKALELLARGQAERPDTWTLISTAAQTSDNLNVRISALQILASRQPPDAEMLGIVREAASHDPISYVRTIAVRLLTSTCADMPETLKCLYEIAERDSDAETRGVALEGLWKRLGDHPQIRKLLARVALADTSERIRRWAFWNVAVKACDGSSVSLLTRDLDGFEPAWDPRNPVTKERITEAASKLSASEDDIRRSYEQIASALGKQVGIDLPLSWTASGEK